MYSREGENDAANKKGRGENDGMQPLNWPGRGRGGAAGRAQRMENGRMLRHNHLVNGPVPPTGLTPPQLHAARRAITVLLLSWEEPTLYVVSCPNL
jgi:hypothetical protein